MSSTCSSTRCGRICARGMRSSSGPCRTLPPPRKERSSPRCRPCGRRGASTSSKRSGSPTSSGSTPRGTTCWRSHSTRTLNACTSTRASSSSAPSRGDLLRTTHSRWARSSRASLPCARRRCGTSASPVKAPLCRRWTPASTATTRRWPAGGAGSTRPTRTTPSGRGSTRSPTRPSRRRSAATARTPWARCAVDRRVTRSASRRAPNGFTPASSTV